MRNRAKEKVGAMLLTLLLFGQLSFAQTSDSPVVLSTDPVTKSSFLPGTGSPFYGLLHPGRKGLQPTLFYGSDDRLFAGFAYNDFSHDWEPGTRGRRQNAFARYSINQNAFSIGYKAIINQLFGQWNLIADVGYDWTKWTNFYGLGNETRQETDDANFYRVRSRDALLALGFQHALGRQSSLRLTPFYHRVQLLRNDDRYLARFVSEAKNDAMYDAKNFGGLGIELLLQQVNDLLLPTKGIALSSGITHTKNFSASRSVTHYSGNVKVYLPLLTHFVVAVENGAATLTGNPEFYQLNAIGGSSLRGYRRERFWGETSFHNNNELQYIFNAPGKLVRGKMGVLAFFDQGRVWKKGELSNTWHYGYGGGVLLVPHNKVYVSAQYGISNERQGFHFTLRRIL